LSAVLLIVAGLLIHSFTRLMSVDKGFETRRLLTAQVTLPDTRYQDGAKRERFYDAVLSTLNASPGVISAGMVSMLPLDGESWVDSVAAPEDSRPVTEKPMAHYRIATEGYFRTLGIQLVAGRAFDEHDHGRNVAVISEKTAKTLWPNGGWVGRRFACYEPDANKLMEVVGVVRNIREDSLQKPAD